jgi:hypothetical protein
VAIFSFGKLFSKKMSFWEQDFDGLLYTPPPERYEDIKWAAEAAVECTTTLTKRAAGDTKICEHGIKAYTCKVNWCYYKSRTCKHDLLKYRCIVCSPHLKCKHDAIKSLCHVCTPRKCVHLKTKHQCAKCSKHLRCDHGTIRSKCKLCNVICIHSKKEFNCNICSPKLTNIANNLKHILKTRNFYQK